MGLSRTRLTIVVSGMIAGDPHQGGATWAVLQYALGLRALGHHIVLIEPISPSRIQPVGAALEESVNASYFRQVVSDFGLTDNAALVLKGTRTTIGLPYNRLVAVTREAEVLLNISGMLDDGALLDHTPVRAFLDLDPAFVQLWNAQGLDMRFGNHTHFVTIGQAIGDEDCPIPTCGRKWLRTLQPIVLDRWPRAHKIVHEGLTTIGHWRAYGSVEHEGIHYGQKAHSLRRFFDLPTRTQEPFFVALAIDPGEVRDIDALRRYGWNCLDPANVAGTPDAYQEFIRGSKAEFGIAKSGYVQSQCGWFSDRSVCYLASGRPVVAQETGFSQYLPTGSGLFAFETADDVLAAIDSISDDYEKQCRAARGIAEQYFDSKRVLVRLLDQLGSAS
jgi:hypothetical protein